ncbi:MAG TPA: SDR family NAD(P)-dependent oxidoreductase [Thermotogota bacterium]|nr:SDR family NAD(P)-dependent oxidoreductase [Thermotogota bacterium]
MKESEKYTVITGASSGIGYETAKAFASRGKNIIVVARRLNQLESLKNEISEKYPEVDVIIKGCDLSISENVYQLYEDLRIYPIETWINNAGFGNYAKVADQDLQKVEKMLHLNVETLTILSSLFISDYKDSEGTQLINVSSAGGYTIVPNAVTYCATKFYVSSFTEGLAREMEQTQAKMKVKLLAPAATKTEFGKTANDVAHYDYDKQFGKYHTSEEMAEFLLKLYDSEKTVGLIDRGTFAFRLSDPLFDYASDTSQNQKILIE